jgi:LacI family transcriptional regulator
MDDLARFCGLNPDRPLRGRRGAGNLSVRARYGKHRHIRSLHCAACDARFSEREGTPPPHSCLACEKAVSALRHPVEGNGARRTGRLVGAHRDAVMRLARKAGQRAARAQDELVAISPPDGRGPARREVVVRRQEAGGLRPRRPGR